MLAPRGARGGEERGECLLRTPSTTTRRSHQAFPRSSTRRRPLPACQHAFFFVSSSELRIFVLNP